MIFSKSDFIVIKIGTSTNNHVEFVKRITECIEKKQFNLDDFLLRKKQSIIDIILREDNLSDTIVPFIENYRKNFLTTVRTRKDVVLFVRRSQ